MVRALWTAASGMTTQQLNVDTISNNIANVNTTSYKRESATFKTLLYQNMPQPNINGSVQNPLQVGHGVKVGAITKDFTLGSLQETGNPLDLAIEGSGFFAVRDGEDNELYTKDGNLKVSSTEEGVMLVTSEGYPLLTIDDEPVLIDNTVKIKDLIIDQRGNIGYIDQDMNVPVEIGKLKLVQFPNKAGLESVGSNMYKQTGASGEALLEDEFDNEINKSNLRVGFLEGSNVNIANEMVNLIVAQRAYEVNSTAIKTADSMLQQANELKR